MIPKHHLINEINQRVECLYCNGDLKRNEWKSLFFFEHHYKETECNQCSKTIRLKMHFHGSGHDTWSHESEFCKFVGKPKIKLVGLEKKLKE